MKLDSEKRKGNRNNDQNISNFGKPIEQMSINPRSRNTKKIIPKHNIIKLFKTCDKERISPSSTSAPVTIDPGI